MNGLMNRVINLSWITKFLLKLYYLTKALLISLILILNNIKSFFSFI